jgi:FAD/FMN-containing dehydrogenase
MSAILLEHFHGAVTRIPVAAAAVPHREEGFNLLIPAVWTDPAATDENVAWARRTYDSVRPYLADRRWLNYLGDDDSGDAVRAAYGPNYDRLVEVKRRYDPENVFRLNHNIDPAG